MSFGGVNTFQQYSTDFGLGHNGVRVSFNYFDGIPEPSLLNALASNELKLIFKSLLKRDETTKEKALGDLLKLIENYNEHSYLFDDDIFFLCWSQVYPKLLVSESKAIRIGSHVVTAKLIKLLNKRISKFLKDLVPLILMGVCDTDLSVSKASVTQLNDVFDNDSNKVSSLWFMFQEYILNVIHEIIVKENEETISDERFIGKEDSQLRFNRLITSAVYLLTNLTESDKFDSKKHKDIYHDIVMTESLWKLLNLKNLHFLKSYEAALRLQQSLYTGGYLTTHKDVLKISTRKLLKSLSQVSSKNVLKVAQLTGLILDTLTMLNDYKDGRIWSYDKTSKEKLLNFLNIASKKPSPGFFNSMFKFYQKTKGNGLIDVKDWLPIWRGSVKALNEMPFLGRFGAELLGELWNNYRKFVSDSNQGGVNEIVEEDILQTLTSVKQLQTLPALKVELRNIFEPKRLALKIGEVLCTDGNEESPLLNNLVVLLSMGPENQNELKETAKNMLESLSGCQEGFTAKDLKIMNVYDYFIKEGVRCLAHEVSQFVYEVPTWIEAATYEKSAKIMIDYSRSAFMENIDDYVPIMDDFITAALSADISEDKVIKTLNNLREDVSLAVFSSPVVQEFVAHYIESYDFNDNGEVFKGPLINENNVSQLYEKAVSSKHLEDFLHHLPGLSTHALQSLFEKSDLMSDYLFDIPQVETKKLYRLVQPFINSNIKITQKLASAIRTYATKMSLKSSNPLYLEYAVDLATSKGENLGYFLPFDVDIEFSKNVPFVDSRLSLLSTLGLNAHLLKISSDQLNLPAIEQFVRYGMFLDAFVTKVPGILDYKLSTYLTMVAELAEDFNCLSERPNEDYHDFTNTLFRSQSFSLPFERIIECVTGTTTEDDGELTVICNLISESSSSTITFYRLRIFHKILQNEADVISSATFTRLFPKIEAYIVSVIRGKQVSSHDYLLVASMLSAMEKFNGLDLFTKLRNMLAAECVGSREDELVKRSHKLIILLNNLLKSWDKKSSSSPVAPQRLNMMLSSLRQWLDSDIAFEPEFSTIRLVLLRLCTLLIQIPSIREGSRILGEVSARLLIDSLTMCQLEETEYLFELRLHCVKLYEQLIEDSKAMSSEISEGVDAALIELCLIHWPAERNNQISSIFNRTLFKIMESFNPKKMIEYYPQFLSAFIDIDPRHNINRTRLLLGQLERIVIEKQKDAFIEYEFRNQQALSSKGPQDDEDLEEDGSANDEFKLPAALIEKLSTEVPQDYLESENELEFLKYLWYWDLTFCFFNEVSYNLRQLFIDQLKSKNLITSFFDFIADQIDMQETKFWKDAGTDAILKYDVSETGFSPYREEIFAECKRLLGHSMYRLFVNVGSLTSGWWLNIKDRSLQAKIEKFVSQFITPILIEKELEDVTNKMDKLKSNDDALTIRINKVTNEVKASYLIDEQKLELSFKLPSNYPLTNVQVIGVSRVGISEQKWKQWIMSAQRVITGMNGTVMDSMELLTRNINLQFSGFEECAICYSILHAVDRKLPTKTCPTCNNKFHGACLYKWFRSSGNNTCPLCRSEIPFRK